MAKFARVTILAAAFAIFQCVGEGVVLPANIPHGQPASVAQKNEIKDSKDSPENFGAEIKMLLERNPFGGAAYSKSGEQEVKNAVQAPRGLELCGIYCVDGKWFFSIYDGASKHNYTLKLGGKYDDKIPYAVDFYDDETNSISISNSVGTYILTLKTPDAPSGKAVTAASAPQLQVATKRDEIRIKIASPRIKPKN